MTEPTVAIKLRGYDHEIKEVKRLIKLYLKAHKQEHGKAGLLPFCRFVWYCIAHTADNYSSYPEQLVNDVQMHTLDMRIKNKRKRK
jgi:hypothetical protein